MFDFVRAQGGELSASVYDGIIAPEESEEAEIIAFLSGTKLTHPIVSVSYIHSAGSDRGG